MSAKFVWPCALMLAVLSTSVVPAQDKASQEKKDEKAAGAIPSTDPLAPPTPLTGRPTPVTSTPAPGELSSWIRYGRPGCCDLIGGDGPIVSELYVRNGPSLPVAGGVLNNTLATGWMVQGGGRSLFFNPSMTSAWTVDLSLAHIVNRGNQLNLNFQLNPFFPPPPPGSTVQPPAEPRTGNVRTLHRTFVSLGLGHEWYLNGAANDFTHYWALWRFGFDGGARLGTSRIDFNEQRVGVNFQRAHDVFWGAFFALHTDVDIPCGGCCIFTTGFRGEWQYDWLDVFPFNPRSNLQSVNLLWTVGVRF